MVGEIRDLETADMAVQAALTGHLVLSTLHTNDAPSAVTRLLDLGAPAYLLQRHAARRDGAAAGAHALPAMQAGVAVDARGRGNLAGDGLAVEGRQAAARSIVRSAASIAA